MCFLLAFLHLYGILVAKIHYNHQNKSSLQPVWCCLVLLCCHYLNFHILLLLQNQVVISASNLPGGLQQFEAPARDVTKCNQRSQQCHENFSGRRHRSQLCLPVKSCKFKSLMFGFPMASGWPCTARCNDSGMPSSLIWGTDLCLFQMGISGNFASVLCKSWLKNFFLCHILRLCFYELDEIYG